MTKISTDPPAFRVQPAQPEEAGAFFAQTPEQYAQMGAIGCVRMDFGKRGTAFWHTWHPRGREELNSPEFKAELQQVVDTLRETVLKDLSSMRHFCYENGGKIPGVLISGLGYEQMFVILSAANIVSVLLYILWGRNDPSSISRSLRIAKDGEKNA